MLSYSWWLRREGSGDYRAALAITIPQATLGAALTESFPLGSVGGVGTPSKSNSTEEY